MDYSLVAIITARGGSKGLPRKNVLDLAGKPLIAYTIDAAIESGVFDRIIVTTDDEEIKNVSLKYGAEVIDRPKELATDTASSLDVIAHALNILRNSEDKATHFMLLQPTSPLRNSVHIQEAWSKYIMTKCSSLVSVTEPEHSPYKMLVQLGDNIEPLIGWDYLTMPRQKLPTAYQLNGAMYVSNIENFLLSLNLFSRPLEIYEMSMTESVDIDTLADFDLVSDILREIVL